ncbi:transposase [Streptomyces sp. NPDC014773]|uniref:transposase n=1 Tax=Streptomyces sp. NPDC014773 TaxID=3364908 RepID=UPI0037007A60
MAREDLSNGQRARLAPLPPQGTKPGGPRVWLRRQFIDGIRWRARTGAPWRDVPERHGPWDRAYGLLRRRQRAVSWAPAAPSLSSRPKRTPKACSPGT